MYNEWALLAAILKSAQGSSTVAITTSAGIVAPLLPALGLDSPVKAALVVMAIGPAALSVFLNNGRRAQRGRR